MRRIASGRKALLGVNHPALTLRMAISSGQICLLLAISSGSGKGLIVYPIAASGFSSGTNNRFWNQSLLIELVCSWGLVSLVHILRGDDPVVIPGVSPVSIEVV
jgi:hypothetical protein